MLWDSCPVLLREIFTFPLETQATGTCTKTGLNCCSEIADQFISNKNIVMPKSIESKSKVQLGVVPTHLKFVGGLVPDEEGRIPRGNNGLLVVENMKALAAAADVKIDAVQVPFFPGLNEGDVEEMVKGFRELGLTIHFILMVGGADPMNPADEDAVVDMLAGGLAAAAKHGVEHVSSTSIEEWMQAGATRKEGADLEAAIAQNVKVHLRAIEQAGIEGSCVQGWHIEFLRGGEFQTFTDIQRAWAFVKAANEALGRSFFHVMVDAAHCGDSDLTISENEKAIEEIGAAGAFGIFHASAKTTRGCLSTDDGWIGALLTASAKTGKLHTCFVEVFHHEDDALQGLRDFEPGHGIDTTDGRSYDQVVVDGLNETGRRLNNLVARGVL